MQVHGDQVLFIVIVYPKTFHGFGNSGWQRPSVLSSLSRKYSKGVRTLQIESKRLDMNFSSASFAYLEDLPLQCR